MFRNKSNKVLYIARHAKSSWDDPGVSDHDRDLMEKGIGRTKLVAGYLSEKGVKPDLIISSSALRARKTAGIIAAELGYPDKDIQIESKIYGADEDDLFEILFSLPDDVNSVMLVGHNPTFTYFANYFLKEELEWMPTSSVVGIEFKTGKWEKIANAKKSVKFVVTPKMLRK
jgi:phosphohistidine phosphatase